jgi:molybdopterin-binding protein
VIRLDAVRVEAGAFSLGELSLEVPGGGYALLIGPTGSGKTTLLEAIAGHLPLAAGRVLLDGRDMSGIPPEARGIGFVYQHYHLFPHLSVRANIEYALHRETPAARRRRGEELAEMLGVTALLDRAPDRLSGGEQQRVALARALAPRPAILLLDEPFAAVDPVTRHQLRRELRTAHEREHFTVLQVSHDFDEALRLGDLVAVLADGRIVQRGSPEEVFRQPNSPFVARFVGAGNVLAGRVHRTGPDDGGRFPGRFESGSLVLSVVAEREGECHAVVRPEDILVSREALSAARNHLGARVTRLERAGPVTYIHLEAGRPLVAAVTGQYADTLGLAPGQDVSLTIKATAVLLV